MRETKKLKIAFCGKSSCGVASLYPYVMKVHLVLATFLSVKLLQNTHIPLKLKSYLLRRLDPMNNLFNTCIYIHN